MQQTAIPRSTLEKQLGHVMELRKLLKGMRNGQSPQRKKAMAVLFLGGGIKCSLGSFVSPSATSEPSFCHIPHGNSCVFNELSFLSRSPGSIVLPGSPTWKHRFAASAKGRGDRSTSGQVLNAFIVFRSLEPLPLTALSAKLWFRFCRSLAKLTVRGNTMLPRWRNYG